MVIGALFLMRSQLTLVRSAQAVRVMASRLIRARRFILGDIHTHGQFLLLFLLLQTIEGQQKQLQSFDV